MEQEPCIVVVDRGTVKVPGNVLCFRREDGELAEITKDQFEKMLALRRRGFGFGTMERETGVDYDDIVFMEQLINDEAAGREPPFQLPKFIRDAPRRWHNALGRVEDAASERVVQNAIEKGGAHYRVYRQMIGKPLPTGKAGRQPLPPPLPPKEISNREHAENMRARLREDDSAGGS